MKYGTLTIAKEYAERGEIDRWLQLFLRADGKNAALADGLLKEERNYVGLKEIPIEMLSEIKSGAPEYLDKDNDIEYFFYVVDQMKESLPEWDAPPLIVEYNDGVFRVNDGRHRLELYRQLGREKVWTVLWTNKGNSIP